MRYPFPDLALRVLPAAWLRKYWAVPRPEGEPHRERQLLVDVSVISQRDARTGIQRVVRNLFNQLLQVPPAGYRVRAVGASRKAGYRYVDAQGRYGEPVDARTGDVFLGLDLAARLVNRHAAQLLAWKRRGVTLTFLVYDLLPVQEPGWFRPGTTRDFRKWLRTLAAVADGVVCISRTVESDFRGWMRGEFGLGVDEIATSVIALGSDPFGFLGHDPHADEAPRLSEARIEEKFVLMVGTLEPRKGYGEMLDAFEALWAAGDRTQLVIAGRAGWLVDDLVRRVRTHAEFGLRLHWLEAPADAHLMELYQRASGLVMASKGEGLGLPILEARCWNKPVLARDIPIFREIADEGATFFRDDLPQALAKWVAGLESGRRDIPCGPAVSWKEARDQLVQALPSPA